MTDILAHPSRQTCIHLPNEQAHTLFTLSFRQDLQHITPIWHFSRSPQGSLPEYVEIDYTFRDLIEGLSR